MCENRRIKNSRFWPVPHSVAIARVCTNKDRPNQEGREDKAKNRANRDQNKGQTGRNGKPLGAERGLTRKARKRNASIPMPFPPSWHQMLRFFLLHPFWVAMWVLPPIARCAIPKVQSFLNFILLAWSHHYKGRSAKCAKIGGSRIRVFDLCPIVSRAHGFSQIKTDRTKKEEKTKQRTGSKQRPKQRTDRKEGTENHWERNGVWQEKQGCAMLPFQCRFRFHQVVTKCFAFFLFHPFWVAMWVLPPIARCAIPKVQSFLNFILLAWSHHYKGRSAKCAKIGGSRIRVFDLCPIVSRSHGFSQTKTDRTKKEEKTKQRTEQTETKTKDRQEGTENHWERNGGWQEKQGSAMLPFQCRFHQVGTKCFAFSCSIRFGLRCGCFHP